MNDLLAVEHPQHLYLSEHSFLHHFIIVSFFESLYGDCTSEWKITNLVSFFVRGSVDGSIGAFSYRP